jgi:hypothetical protein
MAGLSVNTFSGDLTINTTWIERNYKRKDKGTGNCLRSQLLKIYHHLIAAYSKAD